MLLFSAGADQADSFFWMEEVDELQWVQSGLNEFVEPSLSLLKILGRLGE